MLSWRPSALTISEEPEALGYYAVSWRDPVTGHTLTCHRKLNRKRSLSQMLDTDLEPSLLKQSCGMWQARNGERAGWHTIWVQGPSVYLANQIADAWQRHVSGPKHEAGITELILDYYDPRRTEDLFATAYRNLICGCRFCCEPKVYANKRRRAITGAEPRDHILWAN